MHGRILNCTSCNNVCREGEFDYPWWIERPTNTTSQQFFGLQNYTCSECATIICLNCESLPICSECERTYCDRCCVMSLCNWCDNYTCRYCVEPYCEVCSESYCKSCINKCIGCSKSSCYHEGCAFLTCDGPAPCTKVHCQDCYDGEDFDVLYCVECENSYCKECRFLDCSSNWKDACSGCLESIGRLNAPQYRDENIKLRKKLELYESKA